MTLRTKIIIWFILLHVVFAVAAVFVLMENRLLLFAIEGCFLVSIVVSVRLVRALFVPLELIRTGADLMAERDFTSRFVPVGQPEMDRLIDVYNDMVDRLREERLAAEEHHQLLQRIVKASPSGIVICDFDGHIQQTNPGDFVSALTIASARIDSLNRFMGGFADVVRLPPPHPSDIDLAPVIESIATLLRPELEQRGIVLQLDLARNRDVRVDRHQIEQVILNVLRNAMESIGRDGSIDVVWSEGVLSVHDSGRGIDRRNEHELFTPFFTTKRDGRGLGLTIVQEILINHHAHFTLQNREGGGAEFRIAF